MKKKKLLTEQELVKNKWSKFHLEQEIKAIPDGKPLRRFVEEHKAEIEEYGIEVPEWRTRPDLLPTLQIIALSLSFLSLGLSIVNIIRIVLMK